MANSEWRVANSFGGQCFCTAEKFSPSGDAPSGFANLESQSPTCPPYTAKNENGEAIASPSIDNFGLETIMVGRCREGELRERPFG